MNEFILCLIKYTSIFLCMIYAFMKLQRIKPTVMDIFMLPLFILLAVILSIVKINAQILVPIGFLIFGILFLLIRFKKSVHEMVTVGTIALSYSLIAYGVSNIICCFVAIILDLAVAEALRPVFAQALMSICQIVSIWIYFKIRRFQGGIYPDSKNASFHIMLYISAICVVAMMFLYDENVKEYMLTAVMFIIVISGLLLIIWCRKHITYHYRDACAQQSFDSLENDLKQCKLNCDEIEYQFNVYAKQFHYLNKSLPDCLDLINHAAAETNCDYVRSAQKIMNSALQAMNIANEKCSLQNIPQTGIKLIDAPITRLFNESEKKNLEASVDISANVQSWLTDFMLDVNDIYTVLTYLGDNATISACDSPNAKVRIELCETADNKPLLRIYDSGKLFDESVLAKLGIAQITTHSDGHGIGLLSVFRILKNYYASFILDETIQKFGYTKCIEIAFDGKDSVIVRTFRNSVAHACADRTDLVIECPDEAAVCDASIAL